MSIIAFRLFTEDVNSIEHPKVQECKTLLENMATAYKTKLRTFAIHKGIVLFSVNNEEIRDALLNDIEELTGNKAKMASDAEDFVKRCKEEFEEFK